MSPVTFAPGVKDELGTEKLFKSMLGKVYTGRGFDRYGNVEPTQPHLVKRGNRTSGSRYPSYRFADLKEHNQCVRIGAARVSLNLVKLFR